MKRCFQEDVPEWMTQGKTTLSQKAPLKGRGKFCQDK